LFRALVASNHGDQTKEIKTAVRVTQTQAKPNMHNILFWKLYIRHHLKDLAVCRRIILKWFLRKMELG
jgi:hypothetical protein